ncbi:hypothetical protein VTL71DRAFT_14153 [Oculimacula yallundae]|uniref:Enoyl reductase (ER) domain-containing protein n=1 Tax=Oculimacula yallundae TaxID=86028 RepID=A0ABR4CHN0_9HELO
MRAARFYGKEDIRVEEIEEPTCGEGQIKIKPAFVGICCSDLHEYLGGTEYAPRTPHPVTGEKLPITLGHEFSGTILEVGKACTSGFKNICYNGGFVGLSGWGGGLSDACVLSADYAVLLPKNVPLDVGALVEPLAVGWHAVNLSPLKQDSSILILGGGPIGIAVILALRARGCGKILVSELTTQRQQFALRFGADSILDPTRDNVVERVQEATGQGVDIVFDCAGVAVALEAACLAIKARGTVVTIYQEYRDFKRLLVTGFASPIATGRQLTIEVSSRLSAADGYTALEPQSLTVRDWRH